MKNACFFIFTIIIISLFLYSFKAKEDKKEIIIITFQLDKNFKLKPFYYDAEWQKYKEIDFGKKMELFKIEEDMITFENAIKEYKKYLQKCHPNKKIR